MAHIQAHNPHHYLLRRRATGGSLGGGARRFRLLTGLAGIYGIGHLIEEDWYIPFFEGEDPPEYPAEGSREREELKAAGMDSLAVESLADARMQEWLLGAKKNGNPLDRH